MAQDPAPGLVVPWRPAGGCDPTGTWRVTLNPQHIFCDDIAKESFDLALGFVDKGGQTVLVAAGKPVGRRRKIGGQIGRMHVSLISGPYAGCEVRLHATQGREDRMTRIEMVFAVHEDELSGFGTRWRAPTMCNEAFSMHGERSGPMPEEWAEFGELAPPRYPAGSRPADRALSDAVANISAASVLGPAVTTISPQEELFNEVVEHPVRTPLHSSIVEYVAAVVGAPPDVSLTEVVCSEPLSGRCVAVLGDPCRPEFVDPEDICEGMSLNVVVDVEHKRLDRADNVGYPVRSHADIANWEHVAP